MSNRSIFRFLSKPIKLSEAYQRYFDDVEANMRLARSSLEKYKEVEESSET